MLVLCNMKVVTNCTLYHPCYGHFHSYILYIAIDLFEQMPETHLNSIKLCCLMCIEAIFTLLYKFWLK